jgi:hypothetical protein
MIFVSEQEITLRACRLYHHQQGNIPCVLHILNLEYWILVAAKAAKHGLIPRCFV